MVELKSQLMNLAGYALGATHQTAYSIYNNAVHMGLKLALTEFKNHMGKEISFMMKHDYRVIKEKALEKLIKKYDKSFKGFDADSLFGIMKIIPVKSKHTGRYDTFIYYATKKYVFSDREKSYYYHSSDNRDDVYIYIFGKSSDILYKEYLKYYEELNESLTSTAIFDCTANKDIDNRESIKVVYTPIIARKVDTLYYSNNEIDKVLKHIEDFRKNKNFYEERHLLYKTGILLYGEPGTGKSSMVNAIAGVINRSIVNIHIDQFDMMDISAITESINIDKSTEYIILLEDIDTLFLNRNSSGTDKEDNKVINKMLQFLDSNSSPKNCIFIATTNHIERLDPALLRDGRFDLQVKINLLDLATAHKFCKGFGLDKDQTEMVIKAYYKRKGGTVTEFNPSILQNLALKEIGKNVVIETPIADILSDS